MPGKSLDDIWRQMQTQIAAEQQQRMAQERALYEQRERQRQEYLQRMRVNEFSSLNFSPSSAAAAGAGGGGNQVTIQDFPSVSGQSYIITWADDTDNLWKFLVYNHSTGQLSSTHVTDLVISDWALNDDERAIQTKGFTLEFQNTDDTYRIYFVNAEGTVVGEKSLDSDPDEDFDFQYTERATGYLGELNGVSTFYHFDGDNVRTHTFPGISVGDIEIDDAGHDDVTADGSMMVESPNNENYYIARPNGNLVDVSQYFNADTANFRMDYNTSFIQKSSSTYINIVSQEGSLLNTFDLTPFNEASAGANYTIDGSWFYGENCGGADYNEGTEFLEGTVKLLVSYDGDSNEFVSLTFSKASNVRLTRSRRDWQRPFSSFGKNLVISNYNTSGSDNKGYITNDLEMWWLPKGATAFNNVDLTSVGTFSFVLGDGDGDGNGFDDSRSFTLGENPIFMYALENSEIIVGFLEEGGFSTQSTGILSASCSNIWGHNIGEHSFAVFDVGDDRIWQMYDNNEKVAETQTTTSWSWGDSDTRLSLRNGTLAVIDSNDTSNSFIYTTDIGLTAGPTGLGNIYNNIPYGNNTGIAYEYQVITQYIPGEENNEYVDGFYVLSKSGLSEYVEFFVGGLSPSATYSVDDYCIGSEMISFRLQDSDTGYHRYQVYNRSTLALIHDYQYNNSDTNYFPFDNRFYVEYDDNAGNVEIRLVSLSGVQVLNLQTTDFNREANDAEDND
jgi:hypothetical protein